LIKQANVMAEGKPSPLLRQDYPLDRVEVLLVGAHGEAACWT
jgi:hypothetical protein